MSASPPPSSLLQAVERTERLLDLLALEPGETRDTFVAHSTRHVATRVFGGQVLAQALMAAGHTVPDGRAAHSLHGYFLRPGDLDTPIVLAVDRLRDGRSFSARRVQALQDDVPILSMIASFATDGPARSTPTPPRRRPRPASCRRSPTCGATSTTRWRGTGRTNRRWTCASSRRRCSSNRRTPAGP